MSLATAESAKITIHPPEGVDILGALDVRYDEILTTEALAFVADLVRTFRPRVENLLEARGIAQARYDAGELPDFAEETRQTRESDWTVAPIPNDLQDRRVEITGPVDRKMIINALNSGANVFMADFEDSNSPTWANVIEGQMNLADATRRVITYTQPGTGKLYELKKKTAVLMVRARGWHLVERHILVDGAPATAGLVDFGLYLFHNAKVLIEQGTGPYFYLPKLQHYLEARLWNDVFVRAQEALGIPRGTIRATVLVETLPAAFQMDEILWELKDHSAGLNCGRWDYIFSFIKTFANHPESVLPDRGQVTMTQPFMRAYTQLAIKTCHRRNIHSMGGMAAQIPIKNDPEVNANALEKVREDKVREVTDGHDGTWVAHPGLVPLAKEIFDAHMKTPNQIDRKREDVEVTRDDLLEVPKGTITEAGLIQNINVGLLYLEAWLGGNGCVPLYNLMEDAATSEISRSQVWQWVRHKAKLDSGRVIDKELIRSTVWQELAKICIDVGVDRFNAGEFQKASVLFNKICTANNLYDFLTIPAYELLTSPSTAAGNIYQILHTPERIEDPVPEPGPLHDTHPDLDRPHWPGTTQFPNRWEHIIRPYELEDVRRLRGSMRIEYTLAQHGCRRLWSQLETLPFVRSLGALTGNQAVQQVRAGLDAIYVSGWQVAADANIAGQMYPDQSLYPANSVPKVVQRINQALMRADQIEHSEGGTHRDWFAPIMADAEAGFGGPLNVFELMKAMIEAGAAGVHFEDQLSSEKKCGHLGGKVLVPTSQFIRTLVSARLASDVCFCPTVLVARTDAHSAKLITSDVDPYDHQFMTGERTSEGFFKVKAGVDQAIARGLAYAPYADLVWWETSKPDLGEAREFAEAIHEKYPGKMMAYNCSPSFNWRRNLDDLTIARFQEALGEMGYKFQFITLAGFHSLNFAMFRLAMDYKTLGMTAYADMQDAEFALEMRGYTATRHQREVGTGYFDEVSQVISGGTASTLAMEDSTEKEQF
jgi:malate synthase A